MKKIIFLVVALCALGFVLVGCADSYTNPESRELVVFNDTTDQEIFSVSIQTYISTGRGPSGSNALSDGETIQPGARMSFYLPPFPAELYLDIASSSGELYPNSERKYLHKDNFILEDGVSVEARYYYDVTDDDGDGDGYLIEFGGDGYAPPVDL